MSEPLFRGQRASEELQIPDQGPVAETFELTANLTPAQIEFVHLILQGTRPEAAARSVAVTPAIARAWLHDENVQFVLKYLKSEILQSSVDTLRVAHNEAIQYLRNTVNDGAQTPATRTRAAGKIVDIVSKNSNLVPDEDKATSPQEALKAKLSKLMQDNPDAAVLLRELGRMLNADE